MLIKSPRTSWIAEEHDPKVASTAFIAPMASVIGPVKIGEHVMVSPGARIRADEGGRIFIGQRTNIQDNVILHGLKEQNVIVNSESYSIYISEEVSCGHACIIHGPAFIGENTFIGFGTVVHASSVGKNCYIGHGAQVIQVSIPEGKYVPHGALVHTPQAVEDLPNVSDKGTHIIRFNPEVVAVNVELAEGYNAQMRRAASKAHKMPV
jgi:carbonic anhydrase/acetyltransferase-like protein (isoleucine patch superfamily)